MTGSAPAKRLHSLDVFRGITIAGMILVNTPGSWSHVYPPLLHAEWHGWTPTDLIFPFFLFIVGVAIHYALDRRLDRGASRRDLMKKVLRRSAILVLLGLLLSAFPQFDVGAMRFPGVLQRIGLVYLCASMAVIWLSRRQVAWLTAGLLLGYWGLMALVPAPGGVAGDLSPDGNLGAWLDRAVFGTHLWRDAWDPEGLLSTVPAIGTALLGYFTGRFVNSGRDERDVVAWLFVVGWAAVLAGLAWGIVFPINKNLWTSSYVLFTAGAACQMLAACLWLVDVQGWSRWAEPAIVFGRNAIAVFVLSGLLVRTIVRISVTGADGSTVSLYAWVYHTLFVPWAGELNGSLAFALANILMWYGGMLLLHRRGIYVKI
jgi:predicted acyltransferase